MPRETMSIVKRIGRLVAVALHTNVFAVAVVVGHVPLVDPEAWWTRLKKVLALPRLAGI